MNPDQKDFWFYDSTCHHANTNSQARYNIVMDTAKELWIGVSLTILFIVVTVILFAGYPISTTKLVTGIVPTIQLRNDDNENENSLVPTQIATTTVPSPKPTATSATIGYSVSEVAKHSTQNDCWLIIGNGVYNVTNYLFVHPGGANQIIPYCGADATAVFQSIGRHGSSRTQTDLSSVYIGPLK